MDIGVPDDGEDDFSASLGEAISSTAPKSVQNGCIGNEGAGVYSTSQPSYGSYARSIVEGRRRIHRYLRSQLFSDPAFDIILDLYASEEEGRKATVGSVAQAARVPATTGLRYVAALEKEGYLERRSDPLDKRRVLLRLSPSAKAAMQLYLKDISSIPLRR